jgi:hypothetical protein
MATLMPIETARPMYRSVYDRATADPPWDCSPRGWLEWMARLYQKSLCDTATTDEHQRTVTEKARNRRRDHGR